MTDKTLKPCPIEMTEICNGNDPEWAGYYNLMAGENRHPVAGPLHPELSEPFLKMIEAWNTRTDKHTILNEAIERIEAYNALILGGLKASGHFYEAETFEPLLEGSIMELKAMRDDN